MTRIWRPPVAADADAHDPKEVFEAGLRQHHLSNTAYPIAHERTWKPYRVASADTGEVTLQAFSRVAELCLYVHVPFCETRCAFCAYTVTKREDHAAAPAYVAALLDELDLYAALLGGARCFHGMDIGGGTPSFLSAAEMERIVERVSARFRFSATADWSIETTPKIAAAEPDKLVAYRRMGFGRVSMGVQVIQPDLLKLLGRAENGVELHFRARDHLRAAGFERFNVDLMYGFENQSLASWHATVAHAIALGPEYITLYRMRYKLTRIAHQAESVTLREVQALAEHAKELLGAAGYAANPGKTTYSRIAGDTGTSSYLRERVARGMPYVGVGLGAQSCSHTTIAYNDGAAGKNLAPYLSSVAARRLPIQDLYDLPRRQMMGKMCAVSFYFGELDAVAFAAKFGVPLGEVFLPEIAFLRERGLMEWHGDLLRLTPSGAREVNGVIALFFAPSIQAYLLERYSARAPGQRRSRALRFARDDSHV